MKNKSESITVRSHSNIALLKYWGKFDKELNIPWQTSISLTVKEFYTETNISISENEDQLELDHKKLSLDKWPNGKNWLAYVRKIKPEIPPLKIRSHNNFPTASGLASSASAFSALSLALDKFLNLEMSSEQLHEITRIGSGSAVRSLHPAFSLWKPRHDKKSSYSKEIQMEPWKDFRILVLSLPSFTKNISSRKGMGAALSSPNFKNWVRWQESNLEEFIEGLKNKDLKKIGPLIQASTLQMHQNMWCQNPPVNYWQESSFLLWKRLFKLQEEGLNAYGTMDAGPHLKIVHEEKNSEFIKESFKDLIDKFSLNTFNLSPGPGAHVLKP